MVAAIHSSSQGAALITHDPNRPTNAARSVNDVSMTTGLSGLTVMISRLSIGISSEKADAPVDARV
jgi:hypothetical protein